MAELGIDQISTLLSRGESVLDKIEQMGRAPNNKKVLSRRWNVKEASDLVGRSRNTLLQIQDGLVEKGLLDPLERSEKTNRITGYTLRQINQFRSHFKTFPRRNDSTDEPLIIAVQSFKGGVGKTVSSSCISQYLATQGYRVLVVDMDSQATTTGIYGYIPDQHIEDNETLLPYFEHQTDDFSYCIRKTYWDNLDLIPANLQLYNLELSLAMYVRELPQAERANAFQELRIGLDSVKHNYDVIVIDSPPSLGMISLNILCAVDALIVPTPPAIYEFSSTVQYLRMICNMLEIVHKKKKYKFVKILASDVLPNQTNHRELLPILQDVFGHNMLQQLFLHTAEVGNAAIDFQTVLETKRPQKRALSIINSVCKEIEYEIWKTWPSKKSDLEDRGILDI